ncbi:hypothetical protein BH11BAC7_BH11BAC7_23200 [soil metagenome]
MKKNSLLLSFCIAALLFSPLYAQTWSPYNVGSVDPVIYMSFPVNIYPNPATGGRVIIDAGKSPAQIEIYNSVGQMIQPQIKLTEGTNQIVAEGLDLLTLLGIP